jgi:hypothetical protein
MDDGDIIDEEGFLLLNVEKKVIVKFKVEGD